MSDKDPRGFYKCLGVQPDAPASVIKAAYRALAMELHPDRNPGRDTTSQFQKLQEAYAVLSDEGLRQRYDAESSVPNAEEINERRKYKPLEPIVCVKCGAVTAQPRYKVFHSVYGYVFGATRKPHQGIFCSKCEIKVALQSSAITLVVGWWSIAGFLWTCQTLIENLIGGQFNEQNARIQGYQAMYFAQMGNLNLAKAIAVEALKLAEKATKESNKKAASRRSLGYAEPDPLSGLKESLSNLIGSIANARTISLKSTIGVFNKRFSYQSLLLLSAVGLVSGGIYWQELQSAETERIRLERQGIERARAAAIAASEEKTLKLLEKPLPANGIYRIADRNAYDPNRSPPLKVTNAPGANTLIKLFRVGDGVEVLSVFVRAGQTVEVAVPIGNYIAKLASGQTWYGDSIRFGPTTAYAKLDAVLDFKMDGVELLGHQITLTRVKNGNLKQLPLMAADF